MEKCRTFKIIRVQVSLIDKPSGEKIAIWALTAFYIKESICVEDLMSTQVNSEGKY